MRPRADHVIGKHIYKHYGLPALREYHSLPFCELPSSDEMEKTEFYKNHSASVNFDGVFDCLLWHDALYYQRYGDGGGYSVFRFACNGSVGGKQYDYAVSTFAMTDHGYGYVFDYIYSIDAADTDYMPVIRFIREDALRDISKRGAKFVAEVILENRLWVMSMLKYLAQCPGRPVIVTPILSDKQKRQTEKTLKAKPWARGDLSTVIVIDFKEAASLGWKGGTHHSPTPHQRRGHWRTYRHEKWGPLRGKRRWVKPAWVGDREWVFSGSQYRVISIDG